MDVEVELVLPSKGSKHSFQMYEKGISIMTKILQQSGVSCSDTVSGLTMAVCMHLIDLAPDTHTVSLLLKEVSDALAKLDDERKVH